MARSALLLVAGAVTGGAAVWLLGASSAPESASTQPDLPAPVPPLPAAVAPEGAPSDGYASRRIAIYEQAIQANDVAEIETLLELALDEPASRLRDLRLSALLARYAELDPRAAISFARSRYLDPAFLLPLYESWARSDPDGAIAGLALVTPPARQREIALAVLRAIGYDDDAIERVATALPATGRASFEIDGWLARAERNPAGALRELLAMPATRRTRLLPRVAELVASSDPVGAIAMAGSIDDYAQRRIFRDAVLAAWASYEPGAAFAWLESAEIMDLPESSDVYQALAASDPARVFDIVDGLPPAIRANAERAAMQTLAETDAMAALARLDSMPPGQARDQLLSTIAQTYGRQSPDLALAWARNLPQGQAQAALGSVILGIANVDAGRAFDLALASLESGGASPASSLTSVGLSSNLSLLMSLSMSGSQPGMDFGRVADRLIVIRNPTVRITLSSAIGIWSRQDPDAALSWAIANSGRLDAATFTQMAQGVAQADQASALAMIDRVPPDRRPQWVTGLAGQFAQNDPATAMSLINRYRGQIEYASVYGTVAATMARTDPAAAAALLREAPASSSSENLTAVYSVAREWSRRDPSAAADWARGLGDQNMRSQALRQIATSWYERDPRAAEGWIMGMDRGADRDTALSGYVQTAAGNGRFDPRVMDEFSTDAAGQQAVSSAIMQIGRTNPQEARRLLDAHVTDGNIRRNIEDYLARMGGIGSGSLIAPPVVIR